MTTMKFKLYLILLSVLCLLICNALSEESSHLTRETRSNPEVNYDSEDNTTDSTIATSMTESIYETTVDFTEQSIQNVSSSIPSIDLNSTSLVDVKLSSASSNPKEVLNVVSDRVRIMLQHMQDPNRVGYPGQEPIADPLHVPERKVSAFITEATCTNITIHGLSKYKVESIGSVLNNLEINTNISIKRVSIVGNILADIFFTKIQGPFNITLYNVTALGTVYLQVKPNGNLVASETVSELYYEDLKMVTGSNDTQRIMDAVGLGLIAVMRNSMLSELNEQVTREVNEKLKYAPKLKMFAKYNPVDLAIVEGRRYVTRNYEPYEIPQAIDYDSEFLQVKAGPVVIHGLSKFYRVGNVSLKVANSSVLVILRLTTGRLHGRVNFSYNFGKVGLPESGHAYFVVSQIQFQAKIKQHTDLTIRPVLDDLQLQMGQVRIALDKSTKFHYIVQTVVNYLPELIKHAIVDALEDPIRQKIQQDILDKMDTEEYLNPDKIQLMMPESFVQ